MTANERIDGLFGAVAKEENAAELLRLVRDLENVIAAHTLELQNMFMSPDEAPVYSTQVHLYSTRAQ